MLQSSLSVETDERASEGSSRRLLMGWMLLDGTWDGIVGVRLCLCWRITSPDLVRTELPPKSEIQIFSTEESVNQISDIIISGLIFKPI